MGRYAIVSFCTDMHPPFLRADAVTQIHASSGSAGRMLLTAGIDETLRPPHPLQRNVFVDSDARVEEACGTYPIR